MLRQSNTCASPSNRLPEMASKGADQFLEIPEFQVIHDGLVDKAYIGRSPLGSEPTVRIN